MNEIYMINNCNRLFLTWCSEFNANPLQVRAHMSMGLSLEEALCAKHRNPVLIAMNGQTKKLTEWCRQYNITTNTIRRRIGMGCDLKEAFDAPKEKHLAKTYADSADLVLRKPFLDWCRDYLVDPLHIRAAMSMGQSLEYALKNCPAGRINSLPMQVNGYIDTFLDLCQKHHLASNTVRRRVSAGLKLEDAFRLSPLVKGEMEAMREAGRANEDYTITKSLRDWAKDYNQPLAVVKLRMEQGMPLDAALSLVDTDTLELGEKPLTLSELCGRLDVSTSSVRKRMQEGRTILEAVYDTLNSQLRDRFKIDGAALAAARKRAGLSQGQLAELVNQQGDFGFTKFTIYSLENGKRSVSNKELSTISCLLHDIK